MKNRQIGFLLLCVAILLAGCSDDNDGGRNNGSFEVISFETDEGLLDATGAPVVLGDVAIVGSFAGGDFRDVFCGKEFMTEKDSNGDYLDGVLFSTANKKVRFWSYFANNRLVDWGPSDAWGGIALARLPDMKSAKMDYAQQFSVWAKGGADNSETYAVCYDTNTPSSEEWYTKSGFPTIEFSESRTVDHLYIANSTLVYNYFTDKEDGLFQVKITGWNADRETGSVTETLVSGKTKLAGWRKVELARLGAVDKLVLKVEGIDIAADPAYFCIDEIALQK